MTVLTTWNEDRQRYRVRLRVQLSNRDDIVLKTVDVRTRQEAEGVRQMMMTVMAALPDGFDKDIKILLRNLPKDDYKAMNIRELFSLGIKNPSRVTEYLKKIGVIDKRPGGRDGRGGLPTKYKRLR